jgi:serine/threonine-protein kinase HipA
VKELDIFWDGTLMGYLREYKDGVLALAYDQSWLTHSSASPVTHELPLKEYEHTDHRVFAYLDNLLPEKNLRDFIARVEGIASTNVFGLLQRFGGELGSALSFLLPGKTPLKPARYLPVSIDTLREWFTTSRGIPLDTNQPVRMLLSGSNDKTPVFIDMNGQMSVPIDTAPSSHIIKPTLGYQSHALQTAVNEALVMMLAKAVQLNVPDVKYSPELDAVVINRYDRKVMSDQTVLRVHQNDLCQVMGIPAKDKYEAVGGPSLTGCIGTIMQRSSQPTIDKMHMIEWVIFNLAVGNMDVHAKKLSLLSAQGRVWLAPFYNLSCTTVYPKLSRRFAFKIGGENHPELITKYHWDRFAMNIAVRPDLITSIKTDMCERIRTALPAVCATLRRIINRDAGLSMINRVEIHIEQSIGLLLGTSKKPITA